MKRNVFLILSFFLFTASVLAAPSIRVEGRKEVTVTTKRVHFEDIAHVHSSNIHDDDQVIGLKKIYISESPAPGKKLTLSAAQVLEKLQREGINTDEIGYRLPRVMTVKRASRAISLEEIRAVVEEALRGSPEEVVLQKIHYDTPVQVAPGAMTLEAKRFNSARPGEIGFSFRAEVEGEKPVDFQLRAQVEEWVELPVARRSLLRGNVVSSADVMMARLKVSSVPSDVALEEDDIIGLETSGNISYGDVFRKNSLIVPPVIESGSRVTMRYQSKLFTATASGVALEAGAIGQNIRVRNEASKKVVTGEIIEAGLVRIRP